MRTPTKRADNGPTFHADGTVSYHDQHRQRAYGGGPSGKRSLRPGEPWQRRKPRHIPKRIRDEWGIALPGQPAGEAEAA